MHIIQFVIDEEFAKEIMDSWLTSTTPSLVASARISAQETVALQEASTLVLMVSITSKPLAEFLFGPAFFSPVNVAVSSNKIDPSQPCAYDSKK